MFDENGERIFNVDRGNAPSVSGVFTPARDGTFFIAAAGEDDFEQGLYELSLGTDEAASATVTPLVIRPGQTIEAVIGGFGDRDWYRTALVQGQQYAIEMTGDGSADSIGEVEIAVYDDVGVFLGGIEDRSPLGAETFLFTAPETGTFFIAALGEDDRFTGRYRLSFDGDDGRGIGLSTQQAETVALLFEAALNRDGFIRPEGLNFHIDAREAGLSEEALAQQFLDSPEFAEEFGAPDTLGDRALVEILFLNVLNRPGADPGIDFWTDRVGDADFTRAELLIAFAESPENRDGSPFVETLTEVTPGEWDFLTA